MDKATSNETDCQTDRLGPMVPQEMESQEIQPGIQGLESYDDVTKDDVTVFE